MPYWTLRLPRSPMYFPFHSKKPSHLVMTCALLPLSTEDRTGTRGELSQICPMHGSGLPPTPALPPFCVLFGKPPAPLPPSVVSSETPSCFPGEAVAQPGSTTHARCAETHWVHEGRLDAAEVHLSTTSVVTVASHISQAVLCTGEESTKK